MTLLDNITLNDEGFMTVASEWTEELAAALAEKEGIAYRFSLDNHQFLPRTSR